jgi:hypothetical protein
LSRLLNLSPFERNILLLCIAMELDTRIPALCEQAQDNPGQSYPTFALALSLFEDEEDGGPDWSALLPEHPLRFWQLLEITQPNGTPLTSSRLRADERIVNYAKGTNYLDERITRFVTPVPPCDDQIELPPSQSAVVEEIVHFWRQSLSQATDQAMPLPVVQLLGTDSVSKQLIAAHAAKALHSKLFRLPAENLSSAAGDIETLARMWRRESRLLPLALYVDAAEVDAAHAENQTAAQAPLSRFVAANEDIFLLGVTESQSRLGRPTLALDVARPTPSEQRAVWESYLGDAASDSATASGSAAALAGQFDLDLVSLQRIAQTAINRDNLPGPRHLGHSSLGCLSSKRASQHGRAGAATRCQGNLA